MTKDILNIAYNELSKKHNKQKVSYIVSTVASLAIHNIQHYLYAIICMLLIMFLMNCFQFYYYLKYFILNNKMAHFDFGLASEKIYT